MLKSILIKLCLAKLNLKRRSLSAGSRDSSEGRRSPEESRPAWMDEEEDRGRRIRGREDPLEDPEWVDFVYSPQLQT